jgi:hypothetical protein
MVYSNMVLKRYIPFLFLLFTLPQCIRQNYFQADARYKPRPEDKLAPAPPGHVWAVIAPQYQHGRIHDWIWGPHYRKVWATPVPVKVLDVGKVHGGLTPLELGGGMQTTSLTLQNPSGRLYTLRTLDKDPSKALPKRLSKSFLGNIMRDQTSAGNPYAAFTLPPLLKAAGIYHTNPEMYYVPLENNGLGKYSSLLGGKVVMLEEKYKGRESIVPAFGAATDLTDSEEMLKNRFRSNKYKIDQLAFAKARLFDVLIGDWDRHEGQWNWLEYPNEVTGQVVYKPVPKDRDQTYYRFDDGLMPWLVSRKFLVRKLRPFRHNIPDVEGLIYNARFIDHRLLNEVTAAQWAKIAADMKAALTDELLARSVALYPEPIYKLEGKTTLTKLKSRVDELPEAASQFYKVLAEKVTVAGTDEKELFLVKRLDDQTTSVTVQSLPEEGKEQPRNLYYRVFHHQETEELTLHGLGEDDEFILEGEVNEGLKIKIYGGLGADKVTDKSRVKKGAAKTLVYDTTRGNKLDLGKEGKDKTTSKVTIHAYDREGY